MPAANLVGELNGGWSLMTNQLNHERVALTSSAPLTHSIELVREWAQQTKNPDGAPGDRLRVGAGRCSAARTPGPRCSR